MEFIRGLAESFYSPHFYSNLGHKGKGIGAPYILALAILTLLIMPLVLAKVDFLPSVSGFAASLRNLPTVTIKNSVLSIDKPVPYVFPIATDMNIVIDTSYKMGDAKELTEKMHKDKAVGLVTADSMATLTQDGVKIQDFSKAKDSSITPQDWDALAQWFEGWRGGILLALLGLLFLGAFFVGGLFATFFTAIVVSIAGLLARAGLDFAGAMRVAAAIRIPTTLLMFLPYVGTLVSWLIWFAYIIFAVVSCRVAPPKPSV